MMSGIYLPHRRLHRAIRLSALLNNHMTDDDEFLQAHLAVLFTAKVLDACRSQGITPREASGSDAIDLVSLLTLAESELGIQPQDTSIGMMNRWKRYEVEWEVARRRKYCYSFLLRVTSGGIVR